MTLYCFVDLATLTREGEPAAVPEGLRGLEDSGLADLSWAYRVRPPGPGWLEPEAAWNPPKEEWGPGPYDGKGLWPVVEERAELEAWQQHAAEPSYEVDAEAKVVRAVYAAEAKPLAEVKVARLAALAAYRYAKETSGKVWNGMTLDTTDRGKGLLHGAMVRLQRRAPGTVTRWKSSATTEVPIDLATAEAAFDVVSDHIDDLFAAELDHIAAIVACETAEDAGTYDFTAGWPE